jgi:hypothetical protein
MGQESPSPLLILILPLTVQNTVEALILRRLRHD